MRNERNSDKTKSEELENEINRLKGTNAELEARLLEYANAPAILQAANQLNEEAKNTLRINKTCEKRIDRKEKNIQNKTLNFPYEGEGIEGWRSVYDTVLHPEDNDKDKPNQAQVLAFTAIIFDILEHNKLSPADLVGIIEKYVPKAFWDLAGRGLRKEISNLSAEVNKTPRIATNWAYFWEQHVPEVLKMLIMKMTGSTRISLGDESLAHEKFLFPKRISLLNSLLVMCNSQCNHLLSKPLSLAQYGSNTRLWTNLCKLGHAVSMSTHEKQKKNYIDFARMIVETLIHAAVTMGLLLICTFDNSDWLHRRADLAMHVLFSLICFGRRTPKVFRLMRSFKLRELTVEQIKDQTPEQQKESQCAISRRYRKIMAHINNGRASVSLSNAEKMNSDDRAIHVVNKRKAQRENKPGAKPKTDNESSELKKLAQNGISMTACFKFIPAQHDYRNDGKPIIVNIGDEIHVIEKMQTQKLAVVQNISTGEVGYVPLAVVTGKGDDFPPVAKDGIISPKKRKSDNNCNDDIESDNAVLFEPLEDINVKNNREDDRKLHNLNKELIERWGGGPKDGGTYVFGNVYDGLASNLDDVKHMMNEKRTMINEASGCEPPIVWCCDNQEFEALMKELNSLRHKLRLDIDKKEIKLKTLEAASDDAKALKSMIDELYNKLDSVDKKESILLGYFHVMMGLIRGVCNLNGVLCYKGLIYRAGYGDQWDSIEACTKGFSSMGLQLFEAMHVAWVLDVIDYIISCGMPMPQDAEAFLVHCEKLCAKSKTFKAYHRALFEQLATVLDLNEAGEMTGYDATDLLLSAAKRAIKIFTVSGNHKFVNSIPWDLIMRLVGDIEMINAIDYNPTIWLRRCMSAWHFDKFMETMGIKPLKKFITDPKSYSIVENSKLMNYCYAGVDLLEENINGEETEGIEQNKEKTMNQIEDAIGAMRSALKPVFENIRNEIASLLDTVWTHTHRLTHMNSHIDSHTSSHIMNSHIDSHT